VECHQDYQDRFIVLSLHEHPFASETSEIIVWLDTFLDEFKRRKGLAGITDYPGH